MLRPSILALALALASGCVGKNKFDELSASAAQTETALDATEARAANLETALKNAEAANRDLTELAERLDARSAEQKAQLTELSDRVAELSSRTSSQRAQKAELEELLAKVRTDAEDAKSEAEMARERASELQEERDRLAEERDELEARTAEYDALLGELESEIEAGEVTITELSGKLTVNLSNEILFDSGKTVLKEGGRTALAKVAGVLADVGDREIRVEGHTDNVPVSKGAPYPDNWALSALRASNVVALLTSNGVDPTKVAAAGYGSHRPAAPNDTAENRAMNRRIEIVLVPRLDRREEASAAAIAEEIDDD